MCLFCVTFFPHLAQYLNGGAYFYGFFQDSSLFFDKISPGSSGMARTSLIIFLLVHIVESYFNKNNTNKFLAILSTSVKIFLITSMILFQSRTVIFILIVCLVLIFIFINKITIVNFFKHLIYYLLIPLSLISILVNINQYEYEKARAWKKVKWGTAFHDIKISTIYDEMTIYDKFTVLVDTTSKKEAMRSISPDLSSGRFDDWKKILNNMSNEHFYLGYGPQADRYLINQTASNGLIYAYSSSGFFGFLFYLFFSILVSYHLLKLMIYSYKDEFNNFIYCLIILSFFLRSILESSYAVFGIDLIIMMTFLDRINYIKVSINDIKMKFLK